MSPPCDGDDGGIAGNSWCVVDESCASGILKESSADNDSVTVVDYCTPLEGPPGMHGKLSEDLQIMKGVNSSIGNLATSLSNHSHIMVNRGSEFNHLCPSPLAGSNSLIR